MVNNLGGSSVLELNIVARAAIKYLSKSVTMAFNKMRSLKFKAQSTKCVFANIIRFLMVPPRL